MLDENVVFVEVVVVVDIISVDVKTPPSAIVTTKVATEVTVWVGSDGDPVATGKPAPAELINRSLQVGRGRNKIGCFHKTIAGKIL